MELLRSRLFRRLVTTLGFLALLPAVMTAVGAELMARGEAKREGIARLKSDALLARAALAESMRRGDAAAADGLAKRLGREVAARITVIAGDGRVLGDSDHDPGTMENHGARPEVAEARRAGTGWAVRWSDTVSRDMLYVAVRADDARPEAGFVRAAFYADAVALRVRELALDIAVVAVPVALAVFLSAILGIGALASGVREVTDAAVATAGGGAPRASAAIERDDELGDLARAVSAMGSELQARIETISRERNEIATIVESLAEGLIAVDRDRRIVLWNESATLVMGLPAAPQPGARLVDILPRGEIVALAARSLEGGTGARAEVELFGPGGAARVVEARAMPVAGVPPERARAVILLRDITDATRFERLRREFVANVSHELRTPLSLVKGFAETLADGALADPEKGPRFLGILVRHIGGLERLVDDLLTLSALEARAEAPLAEPVEVGPAIERVLEPFEPALAARKIALERSVAPGTPPAGAQADRFDRALRNLVENAAKYTPDGGRIAVRARAEEDTVVVDVSDTGCGIPPADQDRVFERFYRVEKSRTREAGGTGLGLAIVKHILEQAKGSVTVRSEVDRGSTFTLRYPRWRA